VAGDRDRMLLLAPEAQPVFVLDARAVAPGDLDGRVGAARVDHDDLVGEAHAREARADLAGCVERDDGNGQGQLVVGESRHGGSALSGARYST
jgi:hypothetical protein